MASHLDKSIQVVLRNAVRLLEDARDLEFSKPPTSAWFLALIAQEELAKAFMLCLTNRKIIPWSPHILRAMQDHKCKQLVCVVMDYLEPDIEEFVARVSAPASKRPPMPRGVDDALYILRHEKIGRWISRSWEWVEKPDYDDETQAIAEGKRDRQKQDAIYVRLGKDGSVASTPMDHGRALLSDEIDRARRYKMLVESLLDGDEHPALDWHHIAEAIKTLFTDIPESG